MYSTLLSQGYLNVGYIDDSYLQGDSNTECRSDILTTLNLFESLGFLTNHEKSTWKYSLQQKKRERIILACQQLLKRSVISIRKVAHVRLLVSSLPAVQYGPLHYRSLEIDKNIALQQNNGNCKAIMTLSSESVNDLGWWVTSLPIAWKNITMGNPTIEMATDASTLDWGAVCNGQSAQGMWSPLEKQKHINELELLAIYFWKRLHILQSPKQS